MCGWLGFKWTNGDALIQGITRNDLSINRRKMANNYNKRSHLKEFLRRRNNTRVKLDFHRGFNKSRLDRRLKRWLAVVNKEYHRQRNKRKRKDRYLESRNCISKLLDFQFYWGAFPSPWVKFGPFSGHRFPFDHRQLPWENVSETPLTSKWRQHLVLCLYLFQRSLNEDKVSLAVVCVTGD